MDTYNYTQRIRHATAGRSAIRPLHRSATYPQIINAKQTMNVYRDIEARSCRH